MDKRIKNFTAATDNITLYKRHAGREGDFVLYGSQIDTEVTVCIRMPNMADLWLTENLPLPNKSPVPTGYILIRAR